MNTARWLHDQGDCWEHCTYCAWEDERDAAEADVEDDGSDTDD